MPNYRRTFISAGTYFFTVNLLERKHSTLLIDNIEILKSCIREVHGKRPFRIDAWVVLPEHMHCVWTLPQADSDYSTRWRLIKSAFSKSLPKRERTSTVRQNSGERGIWQRHFWEHWIRDEDDFRRHVDYVHVNPLKHKLVSRVEDWPYSTFHRHVTNGLYPRNWCGDVDMDVGGEF